MSRKEERSKLPRGRQTATPEAALDRTLDGIMLRLLEEEELAYNEKSAYNEKTTCNDGQDNRQDFYDEVYRDCCQPMGQAEQRRVLAAVLQRIEEEQNMSELDNNVTDLNNGERRRGHRLGRRRWLTFGLAAALLLAMSSLALAEFGLAPDFLGFFNISRQQAGSLQQSGQEVMRQVSDNGATLRVEQVVGDRHSVYVLLDFVAPEGVALDKEVYQWAEPWVNTENSTGCGYYFETLPDDDPTDNHIRMMLCLNADSSLRGDTLKLELGNLQGYAVEDQDYTMAVEGSWQLSFRLDYEINSRTVPQGAEIRLGEAVAQVVDMELSPISLVLNLETANPEGFEPLAGYVEPQGGGVAIDWDGNEVSYDYGLEPVEVRLNDFLGDLDNLTVRLKDGTVLNTQSGGGSTQGNRSQVIFSFDRILEPEDIGEIIYCGQSLKLQ